MTTRPFPVTPQIDAYIAGEVAKAVSAVEIKQGRELRNAKRETAEALRLRRDAEHDRDVAIARANELQDQLDEHLNTPQPRGWFARLFHQNGPTP